ncbi:hypothetical protein GTW51_23245 [Aurantimonas aggregata]|uniref:BLUF domain-containing protein n=1 Tax=Aurantimonas aggregata TaxID=2047720 RepID=A0A6L9MPR6_9HYPH|nr:hypothetical protein [Aurantimonas aggregata]
MTDVLSLLCCFATLSARQSLQCSFATANIIWRYILPANYLIYVSQARPALSQADLDSILATSRAYNAEKDVTGMLLFVEGRDGNRGSFMQLLEGSADELEALRKRIFADPRHHTKLVLETGVKPQRDFADWSMAFRSVVARDLTAHPGFADIGTEEFQRRCEAGEVHQSLTFIRDFWSSDAEAGATA